MKRLLVLTAAIAVLTAANLRAAEERKVEGGKATAPVVTVNSGTVTLAGEGLNAAAGVWGGKSAAQWYIESIDKIVLLTDAQKKAITEAIEARDKAMQDFQAQNKEKLQAAGKALGEAFRSQDKEKMAQAQKAYQDLYAPMHEAMKKSQKALDDILTPEQREKLQENRMATLIKTLTDPVQLSGEQLGKVKAAYREAAKKGEAEAMRALGVNMQREWHAVAPERGGKLQRVFHLHRGVFEGVENEGRRRVLGDLFLVGEKFDQAWVRIVPQEIALRAAVCVSAHGDDRIAEDAEAGPRADTIDQIGRARITCVEMRERGRRQMAARGRPHHADAIRIEPPFIGIGPHVTDGAQHILHHRRMLVAAGAKAILEYESGDTLLVQPQRVVHSLVRRERGVRTARTNDERGACRLRGRGKVWRQSRNILGLFA